MLCCYVVFLELTRARGWRGILKVHDGNGFGGIIPGQDEWLLSWFGYGDAYDMGMLTIKGCSIFEEFKVPKET